MSEESNESGKDSFTIGTPSTGGAIKMYFDETNAEKKIEEAKSLYRKYVELDKIRKAI